VKWKYDEKANDDPRIKACDEFLTYDAFVQTKEFKEFIIQQRSKDIKERIEQVRVGVDPSQ